MGLRTAASISSSNAAAMAPALTEPISQAQFSLSPSASSSVVASPRPNILPNNGKYLLTKSDRDSTAGNYTYQSAFKENVSHGPSIGPTIFKLMDQRNDDTTACDTTQHQYRTDKHQDTYECQDIEFQDKQNLVQAKESLVQDKHQDQEQTEFKDESSTDQLDSESNTIHPPLSSTCNNNIMGLQKDFLKDNPDMDQMLGDLASTSDLDLLQVFKNLAPNGDNLGELALFNDVDVMNMGLEDVTTPIKEPDTQDIRNEIKKRHTQMLRKCDFLIRRLRKLQARSMGQHVNEEINGLFDYTQKLLKRKDRESKSISTMTPVTQLQTDKQKQLTSYSMKNLLKRIDNVASDQQNSINKNVYTDTSNTNPMKTIIVPVTSIVPTFDADDAQQSEHTAGFLHSEFKIIANAIDSDVTASSSGGESADEMVTYNNQSQESLSIAKRAAWRWARDRSGIASRWTWLLAQISDLEYRIRQHSELHYQIKKNKGAVILEDDFPSNQIDPSQQSVNGYRGVLPGNTGKCSSNDDTGIATNNNGAYDLESLNTGGSCRTTAFQRSEFRKRKLLQTTNLHTISKKAAKPSTVKCGCQWPLHPCALCTGRQDPTAPRDLPDMIPARERVSLLDPSYHPVISFPDDVSQSIHFEATLRSSDFQTKANRSTSKAAMRGAIALQKAIKRDDQARKQLFDSPPKKKYNLVATKLKKKAKKNNNVKRNYAHMINNKIYKKSFTSATGLNAINSAGTAAFTTGVTSGGNSDGGCSDIPTTLLQSDNESAANGAVLPRSINSSPTPGSSNYKYEKCYSAKKPRNSYDIDNIVIPYSVAAATRVEILKYKEIPTPKWRLCDDDIKVEENSQQIVDENEELANDSVLIRHERALTDERKKFSTFLKFPWSTRSRANRRIDSRADSSGANTPDPTSPAPKPPSVGGDHESIPSPAALQAPNATPEQSSENSADAVPVKQETINAQGPSNGNMLHPGSLKMERRRTLSTKKLSIDNDAFKLNNLADSKDVLPSYSKLKFPIVDDIFETMLSSMPVSHKNIIDECLHQNADNEQLVADMTDDGSTRPVGQIIKSEYNFETFANDNSGGLRDSDEETESVESGQIDEDPNDPEWCEPPSRL